MKKHREDSGLSLSDICARANCSYQTIYEIERAGSYSERLLRDVAAALRVNYEWLRSGKEPKQILLSSLKDEQVAASLERAAGLKVMHQLEAGPAGWAMKAKTLEILNEAELWLTHAERGNEVMRISALANIRVFLAELRRRTEEKR